MSPEADSHLRPHRNVWPPGDADNVETSGVKGMDMEVTLNIKTEYDVLSLCIDTYMTKTAKAFTT